MHQLLMVLLLAVSPLDSPSEPQLVSRYEDEDEDEDSDVIILEEDVDEDDDDQESSN